MIVVSNSLSGVTSRQKTRRRETCGGLRGRGPSVTRGLLCLCSRRCCSRHWCLPGNTTMVLFYFSPYISCISHGILFPPLPLSFSPPSPLLLPSLYPTNHRIGGSTSSSASTAIRSTCRGSCARSTQRTAQRSSQRSTQR